MIEQNLILGILAHVDAGKTTLSEALLHITGAVRRAGRVDHGDAFLDTDDMEKERGITIFSKQARFTSDRGETRRTYTLQDTPGHVDFSTEMERVLGILDCAVLVISAADGVNGQVRVRALQRTGFSLCQQDGPERSRQRGFAGLHQKRAQYQMCGHHARFRHRDSGVTGGLPG